VVNFTSVALTGTNPGDFSISSNTGCQRFLLYGCHLYAFSHRKQRGKSYLYGRCHSKPTGCILDWNWHCRSSCYWP
jgi:hypothetical protein